MSGERKYKFSWELIGDIEKGRPNLGKSARLEVYRLMQFTFRDIIEQQLGTEKTDEVFFDAGKLAGQEFYNNMITPTDNVNDFIGQLQRVLTDLGIGVLRIEKADIEKREFVLTVSEDLDCSGLPELDYEICTYDEGFISSLLEGYFKIPFQVKEVDCWCTGDRTCRFKANALMLKEDRDSSEQLK